PGGADTPVEVALTLIQTVARRAGVAAPGSEAGEPAPTDGVSVDHLLAALMLLRWLSAELDSWEPLLIRAARDRGASWADLARSLGVASRQAAERRYLRLRVPDEPDGPGTTREARVLAERDRRAGQRAVSRWARDNSADLRQLAGQITALTDLDPDARTAVDRLYGALSGGDPTTLVPLLADARHHLRTAHPALAERVD